MGPKHKAHTAIPILVHTSVSCTILRKKKTLALRTTSDAREELLYRFIPRRYRLYLWGAQGIAQDAHVREKNISTCQSRIRRFQEVFLGTAGWGVALIGFHDQG